MPFEDNYEQTYPTPGTVVGVGTGVDHVNSEFGPYAWDVALTEEVPLQANMNFGNKQCELALFCPPDITIECDDPEDPSFTGSPTYESNCGPVKVNFTDNVIPGDCVLDGYLYIIERTFTATDNQGQTETYTQTITVTDNTPPVIAGVGDDETISCDAEPVFSTPTASDDCDPDPLFVFADDTTMGDCPYNYSITRTWTATDTCGNVSDQCCQTIIREPCSEPGCTFTIGGWGSDCPDEQQDRMMSTQPGCVRDHYFSTVFPGGEVVVGHHSGFTASWTSAMAIQYYLPAGETPAVLTENLVNPSEMQGNVLISQILALTLNREYICAGVFYDLGLWPNMGCYGTYVIGAGGGGIFDGMTVDEFLEFANKVVSGKTNMLNDYGATLSDVNYTATCLNELYSECDPYFYAAPEGDYIVPENDEISETTDPAIPVEYGLSQNSPNPFNPVTHISFSLPEASRVRLQVFNITGQVIATLVDGQKEAGHHSVSWDASRVASGIYFYRLETDAFISTKKMVLLK